MNVIRLDGEIKYGGGGRNVKWSPLGFYFSTRVADGERKKRKKKELNQSKPGTARPINHLSSRTPGADEKAGSPSRGGAEISRATLWPITSLNKGM